MRAALSISASVPLFAVALLAQDERPETYGHSLHGTTFDEGPRSAAYLMDGMCEQVHFPVEGLSPRAQQFFDQGITQQHGFWYFEAERSFRQVATLHPDCAMAYWGMARANDENAGRAAGFMCKAVACSESASKREQMWIDARARYYGIDDKDRAELRSGDAERVRKATEAVVKRLEGLDKKIRTEREKQLIKDLGTIVYEYPDDLEAKAFLAVQNWLAYGWGSGVEIVSHTAIDALLDQVFEKAPLHPAHHYRIHLWDREDARRALRSAGRNGFTAPAIAHQWHMSGHIYAKLHRHREAAWQQEASSRADHKHMMRDGVMPFLIHNYGHNQEWLARSLSHCGRVDEALAIARNLAELPRHPKWNRLDDRGSIADYGRQRLVQICEDHGLWERALDLVEDGYLEASDDLAAEVDRLRLLGRANYRLGRLDRAMAIVADAEALLNRARAARAAAIDEAEQKAHERRKQRKELLAAVADAGRAPTDTVQSVLDLLRELDGERLLASGDAEGALEQLAAVRGLSKVLLAGVQVAAGQADKAIEALEKDNERSPNRGATLAALVRAQQAVVAALPSAGEAADPQVEAAKAELGELVLAAGAVLPRDYLERYLDVGVDALRELANANAGGSETAGFGADFGERPPLASIGPRTWAPVPNAGFDLEVAGGGARGLPARIRLQPGGRAGAASGRATLVVFYLGFGCLHCVEQLHALRPMHDAFAAAGIDVIAVGSDDADAMLAANLALAEEERMPFPMLADPRLTVFKAWRCYDDFEQMTLHGTFLVDGHGRVRWQDISYEPFMDIGWLLAESRRLLALPVPAR